MEYLKIIEHWLSINNLFLNYKKPVILLHLLKINTLPNKKVFYYMMIIQYILNINCRCKKFKIMNNIKYLDREICSNMKWNEKINLITQKIIKKK